MGSPISFYFFASKNKLLPKLPKGPAAHPTYDLRLISPGGLYRAEPAVREGEVSRPYETLV